jgi:ubiquinone/menaquinone biosynthesis C-methylase UbiE
MKKENVRDFYDVVWTKYIPEFKDSKEHLELFFIEEEVKDKDIFDCGCGTGIFANIFASMGAKKVVGFDLSPGSLRTGKEMAAKMELKNIEFVEGDMLQIPFEDNQFDIVWAWGSAHHTENPMKAIDEIDRMVKKGGSLLLALYKKTKLTWIHEIIRKTLLMTPKKLWPGLANIIAFFLWPLVKFKEIFRKKARRGEKLAELILDWYFVPIRFHYYPAEIEELLVKKGYKIEKYLPGSGRFESASNFIYKANKLK